MVFKIERLHLKRRARVSIFHRNLSKYISVYKLFSSTGFKGGPSDLGTRILQKYYKKSSLYSQSLLIFIHRTPVVERHPITREMRDFNGPGRHQRETQSIFTRAARSFTH